MMTPELADVLALIRARTMSSLTADERTLVLAVVEARHDARAAAIEECAKVCDEQARSARLAARGYGDGLASEHAKQSETAARLAARLRALLPEPGQ